MREWSEKSIEMRDAATLNPYERNPRTHPESQIEQLKNSIRQWGWTVPILIDEDDTVLAGHGRLHAATEMMIEQVPCVVATGWSEDQKRAYVIADNQIALNAGWDMDVLEDEIRALDGDSFSVDMLGFDEFELSKMLAEVDEIELPALADGEKEPFQQMTFTLHDEQVEQVKAAIDAAKAMGAFVDSPNENGNGNSLARICETFLTAVSNGKR